MILSADFCMLTNVQPNQDSAEQIVRKYAMKATLEVQPQFKARPMGFKAVVLICSKHISIVPHHVRSSLRSHEEGCKVNFTKTDSDSEPNIADVARQRQFFSNNLKKSWERCVSILREAKRIPDLGRETCSTIQTKVTRRMGESFWLVFHILV